MNTKNKNSIVVVNDDTNDSNPLMQHLKLMMQREGCEVISASPSADIRKICLNITPLLVILDLLTPETEGDKMIQRLKGKSETRDIPVIVLINGSESGIDIGADEYMTKPLSPRKLIEFVRIVVARDKYLLNV